MPEAQTPSLAEDYLLEKQEKSDEATKPVEEAVTAVEEADETPVVESSETADKETTDEAPASETETATSQSTEPEAADDETPDEIKLETAPGDFRFPTTNQTRHCFTRYIEYHRCVAAKGDDAPECDKFAKYYRSLCPGEWVDKWNEQRENGTFPGPL